MDMEGPVHPSGIGGMVETMIASVGMPLMGGMPKTMCVVVMGPLEGILVMMGDKEVGPLQNTPP